ncbi:MAG: dihydroorotate dehydrogenase (quinone) [Verrucomicrobia bacterium]|nr:MAG: dihydroorotate dehydrogenase (quinone) [Verrucomicrobiota bacterium]
MDSYRFLLRQVLFRLDAEVAHDLVLKCLSCRPIWSCSERFLSPPPSVPFSLFNLHFRNPVGLAAGMDKDGVALEAWEKLGFGFVEVGTVTALPQLGNPKPRLFRFPELGALINRMGFNNNGARSLAQRMEALQNSGKRPGIPIGINIGKSRVIPLESAHSDYLESFRLLYQHGDYIVLNVSSPNTPGLRDLQHVESLAKILGTLRDWEGGNASKPLLLKIAPDLAPKEITDIASLCEKEQLAGIIATNTTLDHSALRSNHHDEIGGLSGRPLQEKSTAVIRQLRDVTHLPIVGCGGIFSSANANEKFQAGANLVQIYTGFIYRGPALIREICSGLPYSCCGNSLTQ